MESWLTLTLIATVLVGGAAAVWSKNLLRAAMAIGVSSVALAAGKTADAIGKRKEVDPFGLPIVLLHELLLHARGGDLPLN